MTFSSRWQYHLLWTSIFVTSLSGMLLLIMKYFLSPMDKFSVLNHPWQAYVLKTHILFAPLMVFSLGYTTILHALPYWNKKMSKAFKTGLSSLSMIAPMVISGYLIQSLIQENWVSTAAASHIVTSLVFLVAFTLHELFSHKERYMVHSIVIFIFLFFSSSPLWTSETKVSFTDKSNISNTAQLQRAWMLMGTIFLLEIKAVDQSSAENKAKIVWEVINEIDQKMSTYKENSEVSKINRLAFSQEVLISNDLLRILSLSKLIHQQSQSAFDITSSPLINLWEEAKKIRVIARKWYHSTGYSAH